MNRLLSLKSLAATAVVLGAFGAATAAHARSDVQFSISLGTPGVYVQPTPVYVPPPPVYVQPRPVYVRPAPVYVQPYYGWHHPHGRHVGARGPWGDADHDGTPNRYDRFPTNPHRR
ncbi:MAG: hypothetical protein KIS62_02420 [Ramlibacter sp.]|nr:hypothetical protein [Ramlibacter sp.]